MAGICDSAIWQESGLEKSNPANSGSSHVKFDLKCFLLNVLKKKKTNTQFCPLNVSPDSLQSINTINVGFL